MKRRSGIIHTFGMSVMIHGLLFFLLSGVFIAKHTGKMVYLTEISLFNEMSYGNGLGTSGPAAGDTTVKQTSKSGTKSGNKTTTTPSVKGTKIVSRSEKDIIALRRNIPIGEENPSLRSSETIAEGPVIGGGFGSDSEVPGSITGNPDISGTIASRGILHHNQPEYPDWARKKGVEGEIQVLIIVTPAGDVREVAVIKTCGYKELDQVVIDSMRKWKFDILPITVNQINQDGMIKFRFSLKK
jgi:protein TonB